MVTRTLILALSLTAAPAVAVATENRAVEVRVDDLSLTRTADRERLDTRLKSAARSVCRTGLRGAAESARQSACVSNVLSSVEFQAEQAIARAQNGTQLALLMIDAAR
ncbi:UrcA family protein [Sphingopyxis sp. OAS728]|uniref:UrcA family protein n=1 Tax=Sphingopyxis sp. OAS728 TaxID=2663823 RepID=UPI0017890E6E|nr:UrcA family protein [Sphingopyxis sp. OAS728]MBE1526295.1 UrcA family protein [Sphingopyxis sp. OAS728]